jgi:hypothetical protein
MGYIINTYSLLKTLKEVDHLGDTYRWVKHIKIYIKEIRRESVNWIELAQVMSQWSNTFMILAFA